MPSDLHILIRGARQNNLKNLSLELPLNALTVVTGVSGSGKSSLAFDTLYAEGQRRYVETFSPYARQFLDRMDKPQVDLIEGVPPAIAIDQSNPVRTSRSTVGTMTELNDHLKLLFARAGQLFCRQCARPVRRDTPDSIVDDLTQHYAPETRIALTFAVPLPDRFNRDEIEGFLRQQGYTRVLPRDDGPLEVIQDRLRLTVNARTRVIEAVERALAAGNGRMTAYRLDPSLAAIEPRRYSTALHCPDCEIHYADPTPSLFSFNSPLGACDTCRGFGRVIGIDYGLVIPDDGKTLAGGAIKPWQTESYIESQGDLMRFAKKRGIRTDLPWHALDEASRRWVIDGEGDWDDGKWYGVRRFFAWLEGKSYKMHIRVLLSKYRSYDQCPACAGARLKTDALLWRIGARADARAALAGGEPFLPSGVAWTAATVAALPGLTVHDVMRLPITRALAFLECSGHPDPLDQATDRLLGEIRTRLRYLVEVGLGYLNLDRQSRTLSGGEVQRINLTTALGTSLVNTLFVLDEPSIGLHPRDIGRIQAVLERLRDAGNTLVVVEHDPQLMLAADRILDIGPGAGAQGGDIVFFGAPAELLRVPHSLTAAYLRGDKCAAPAPVAKPGRDTRKASAPVGEDATSSSPEFERITLLGAAEHNLKHIDVAIPLRRLVCITGVSGSGKSTLVQDVLHPALCQHFGRAGERAGAYRGLTGAEHLDDVILVDQSAIGKTTRSNPASYVSAFDAIRKRFAATELARERGYTVGSFSFNAGTGRCPTCGGNGFEHVEMQFLADVYLRCPDCDGKRYRGEILEVGYVSPATGERRSIAEVLDLTVTEALVFFASDKEILTRLRPLAAVGLDYLQLGQPVPTLSGGEAQRLKLAGHLAAGTASGARKHLLFLLDEPTTGLHFDDIAKLLGALRHLQAHGHSLVIVEHNLDVIGAADWVIDLGPEGGDGGGALVFEGPPAALSGCESSHTGRALRAYAAQLAALRDAATTPLSTVTRATTSCGRTTSPRQRRFSRAAPRASHAATVVATQSGVTETPVIEVNHAREHNLKNISVQIPRDRFTVITGVSGSGKSTLAFDILFAEGQRRYLESLNAYARQFVQPAARPDLDAVRGIPPTVAIEQRTSRGGRKSTVATLTEIYHFLRLLYVKLGTQYCPDCAIAIEPQTADAIVATLLRTHKGRACTLLAPLVVGRKGYYTDLATWAHGHGYTELRVDGVYQATANWPRLDRYREHHIELPLGDLKISARSETALRERVARALEHGKGVLQVTAQRGAERGEVFSTLRACPGCGRGFPEPDPRMFSFNSPHGWCPSCFGSGERLADFDAAQTGEETRWYEADAVAELCPTCNGHRLRAEALAVRWHGASIATFTARSVAQALAAVHALRLKGREAEIARDLLPELQARLSFLADVGLGYLGLDRAAPSLSGGEAQRLRLAAQLGSSLRGVCYILDEPTIGLHPRDNAMLLNTLEKLKAKGNTVIVVEHDEETIRRAEHLIDIGPGAGLRGGEVVATGTVAALIAEPRSVTGHSLAQPLAHPLHPPRSPAPAWLDVRGVRHNNLRDLAIELPLNRLVCITGVSGSGKSSLVREVIEPNLRAAVTAHATRQRVPKWQHCASIDGWQSLARVLEVDQTPIGKTPRSCPATYIGFWNAIRKLYAATPEARVRGYQASRFSFNVGGGRCPACEGQGMQTIEMSFLPDVKIPCEVCGGARFNAETLAVHYRQRSIGDLLALTVADAVDEFAAHPAIHHALTLMREVGLGYLTLGQPSPTLSGGEAQRIKLVAELAKARPLALENGRRASCKATLYVLDEPTVGLHMADVARLIQVLHRLVDAGNTVFVIEHNLDLIAEADWIIDLGPEAGDGGGRVVASGAPNDFIRQAKCSLTARHLKDFLAR
ncbi:MAG: excinuclease ABC subunit UvrA [Thiotrichales bacterium]